MDEEEEFKLDYDRQPENYNQFDQQHVNVMQTNQGTVNRFN